jgi:hypothetical protein
MRNEVAATVEKVNGTMSSRVKLLDAVRQECGQRLQAVEIRCGLPVRNVTYLAVEGDPAAASTAAGSTDAAKKKRRKVKKKKTKNGKKGDEGESSYEYGDTEEEEEGGEKSGGEDDSTCPLFFFFLSFFLSFFVRWCLVYIYAPLRHSFTRGNCFKQKLFL